MAGTREIRSKIRSVENTRKITKAMEMVAASKMRKAQERMEAGRPYCDKVREMARHLMQANPEYEHPYMHESDEVKALGIVLVTTDRGLCGGVNTNILRLVLERISECQEQGIEVQTTALGSRGAGTLARIGANLVSQEVDLGDEPNLERLIGAVKVQIDAFVEGKIDAVYLASTRFVNTMRQEPTFTRLLPLPSDLEDPFQVGGEQEQEASPAQEQEHSYGWDYIYEPDAKAVIDELLLRYVEALVYQAVAENMADR